MSKGYWIKRQAERETKAYSNILDIEKQYKLSLEQARANIEKEIRHIGTKYMRDNALSFNEASKLLKGDEFKLWKKDLHEYMAEYKDLIKTKPLEAQKLWLEIETLSARSRMSHLDTLRVQIDKELIKVSAGVDEKITHELTSVYRDTYTDVVKDLGISKVVDKEKIKAVLDRPWSGANYSQRLWGNTEKLSQVLKQEVVNGMIQGINLNTMTKRLTARFDTAKKNDVERLLRTEVNYTLNQATLDGYKDAGVNKYEFNATLDSRTSQICASLHGEKFDVSAIAVGINYPPMHPRCRSTTIPIVDYEALGKSLSEKELKSQEESNIIELERDFTREDRILSTEETLEKAKLLAEEYLKVKDELLKTESNDHLREFIDKKLGINGLPTVLEEREFKKASFKKAKLFRGVQDFAGSPASELNNQFKFGEFKYGSGRFVYGRGTYTTPILDVAQQYGIHGATGHGEVMTMMLKPEAKIVSFVDVENEIYDEALKLHKTDKSNNYSKEFMDIMDRILRDEGTYSAIKGYDAISLDGYDGEYHFVIQDRSKLIINKQGMGVVRI